MQFGEVRGFIQQAAAEKLAPQLVAQIQEMLSDEQRWTSLRLELAAIVNVGVHFVNCKSCHLLPGGRWTAYLFVL